LHIRTDSGNESAASDRDEDCSKIAWMLANNFIGDGSLTSNDERIIERVNECQPGFFSQTIAVLLRLRIMVACEYHFCIESFDSLNLDVGRSLRHHDDGSHSEMFGRQRHTLCMVSCARRDDTNSPLRLRKPCDPVVRASDLETEDRLLILT